MKVVIVWTLGPLIAFGMAIQFTPSDTLQRTDRLYHRLPNWAIGVLIGVAVLNITLSILSGLETELRQKILLTLLLLAIYRIGWQISLPMINQEAVRATPDAMWPSANRLHYAVDYLGDMMVAKHDRAVAHRGVEVIAIRQQATGMRVCRVRRR